MLETKKEGGTRSWKEVRGLDLDLWGGYMVKHLVRWGSKERGKPWTRHAETQIWQRNVCQRWKTNLANHSNWWATKNLQVNWHLTTDKDVNLRVWDAGGVGGIVPDAEGMCTGQDSGRYKVGADRKRCKRSHLCVSQDWSAHWPDWAWCLITAICPTFLLNPSLTNCIIALSILCSWVL